MIEEALDRLLAARLVDEDGDPVDATLLPGLTEAEIAAAERALGARFPDDLRRVLARTRGLEGLLGSIDLSGGGEGQALEELFPRMATIAEDGYGNSWGVDLLAENGLWGPVWFLSHDPPAALLQCDGLAAFLDEIVRMQTPPHASLIRDVHEDRLHRVGREHPGSLPSGEAMASDDAELASFGRELGPGWVVVDCRDAVSGMGVAWGRFGARTELRRHGVLPIFALRAPEKRGLFRRR